MRRVGAAGYPVWLLCLFVGMLALGTDEFVISGILPDVARDLEVTPGTAGLLVTAFAIAFAAGAPMLAFLTDRLNKKSVLTGALVIFAVANAAVAVSDEFTLTLLLRVVAGLAAAAVSPTCMVIAGMAAPDGESGRYLAVVTAGLTVALFTGVPFGAFLGDALTWRATFVLIALVGVLVAVLSALWRFHCSARSGSRSQSLAPPSVRLPPPTAHTRPPQRLRRSQLLRGAS